MLLGVLVLPGTSAQDAKARRNASIAKKFVKGQIRVIYESEGPHAVDPADKNQNSVPDQVENVAIQAWAAWRLWTSLGFCDPLKSSRYKGVSWIDVKLLSKDIVKANGVAFDEMVPSGRSDDPANTKVLRFNVATSVDPILNLTPAHEMFHIIQNGTTFFKNSWYTEGTARWSESGLGLGAESKEAKKDTWPPRDEEMPEIYTASYRASGLYWEPLFKRADRRGKLDRSALPEDLKELRYTNGDAVLKDFDLVGADFLREVLEALDQADDQVARDRKLESWPEAEQRSLENNPIIHQRVMELAKKHKIIR